MGETAWRAGIFVGSVGGIGCGTYFGQTIGGGDQQGGGGGVDCKAVADKGGWEWEERCGASGTCCEIAASGWERSEVGDGANCEVITRENLGRFLAWHLGDWFMDWESIVAPAEQEQWIRYHRISYPQCSASRTTLSPLVLPLTSLTHSPKK